MSSMSSSDKSVVVQDTRGTWLKVVAILCNAYFVVAEVRRKEGVEVEVVECGPAGRWRADEGRAEGQGGCRGSVPLNGNRWRPCAIYRWRRPKRGGQWALADEAARAEVFVGEVRKGSRRQAEAASSESAL